MPTTIAPRLLVPLHRSLAGLLLTGLLTSHAGGQCQIATLVDGEGASGDGFGGSVSTDGATALVGAPLHDGIAANTGAAPVFLRVGATWTEVGRLTAPDADAGDKFGHAVAIDGVWALIGAPEDDDRGDGAGAAYVFRFDGSAWQPHVKLLAPDGAAGDRFGYSVALHGEVAVAGAYRDDDMGSNSGSAQVFRFDGAAWSDAGKLTASDGNTGDWFGRVVTVHGETVMVGATQDDDHGGGSGSVYVFTDNGSGWAQTQKIAPDETGAGDRFGGAIDLEGTLAVVGAQLDDTRGSNAGAVYALRRIGGVWSVEAKLFAPGAMPGDRFGRAVAVSQGRIAVGAPETDLAGPSAGAVHCFEQSGTAWADAGTLLPDGAAGGDEFGSAITMAGGSLASGAANADAAGVDAGAAFVFAGLLDMDCNGNGMPDDCDIASGASQDSDGDGVPDECTSLFGDVNGDGVVDYEDLTLISGAWGPCPPAGSCPEDVNGDGFVDVNDFLAVLAAWTPSKAAEHSRARARGHRRSRPVRKKK